MLVFITVNLCHFSLEFISEYCLEFLRLIRRSAVTFLETLDGNLLMCNIN